MEIKIKLFFLESRLKAHSIGFFAFGESSYHMARLHPESNIHIKEK